jgi:hypothetical protein
MRWMSVKLPENFQIREHSWPVSFNQTVVPWEISKVSFRVEAKILVSMSEET